MRLQGRQSERVGKVAGRMVVADIWSFAALQRWYIHNLVMGALASWVPMRRMR